MNKIFKYIKENFETVTDVKFDGNRIVIYADKPSWVVGRRGKNIKELAEYLTKTYMIEKPEISVIDSIKILTCPNDGNIMVEKIGLKYQCTKCGQEKDL